MTPTIAHAAVRDAFMDTSLSLVQRAGIGERTTLLSKGRLFRRMIPSFAIPIIDNLCLL